MVGFLNDWLLEVSFIYSEFYGYIWLIAGNSNTLLLIIISLELELFSELCLKTDELLAKLIFMHNYVRS